jgi:hypothetical protein
MRSRAWPPVRRENGEGNWKVEDSHTLRMHGCNLAASIINKLKRSKELFRD